MYRRHKELLAKKELAEHELENQYSNSDVRIENSQSSHHLSCRDSIRCPQNAAKRCLPLVEKPTSTWSSVKTRIISPDSINIHNEVKSSKPRREWEKLAPLECSALINHPSLLSTPSTSYSYDPSRELARLTTVQTEPIFLATPSTDFCAVYEDIMETEKSKVLKPTMITRDQKTTPNKKGGKRVTWKKWGLQPYPLRVDKTSASQSWSLF